MNPMLSAEDRLLICCADTRASEEPRRRVQGILCQDLRWDKLIQKASRQGLSPLLYSFLSKLNDQRVPDEALNRLKNVFYANAARNLELEHELAAILKSFRRRTIDCMVLKGLFILYSLYDNVALRPMADIDLLVHRDDLPKAHTALGELGYSLQSDSLPIRFYQHVHFHVTYVGEKPRVLAPVEVHWNIQDCFNVLRIDIDRIWERAVSMTIGDFTAQGMGSEDLLAYLCYHADKHSCFSKFIRNYSNLDLDMVLGENRPVRLLWYSDILKLIALRGAELDWMTFSKDCRRWGIEGAVFSTLSWVNRIFGDSIAGEATIELRPPKVRGFQAKCYRRLLGIEGTSRSGGHSFSGKLKQRILGVSSTLQFRPLRFLDILAYMFPDVESISSHHSSSRSLVYAYYIRHVCKASFHTAACLALLTYYILKNSLLRRIKKLQPWRQAKCLLF